MPIKKAAMKHLRQTKKRTSKNNQIRKTLKQFIKQVRKEIVLGNTAKVQEFSLSLQKIIDKAAKARVIKKNTAARRKSRLMKKISGILKT